MTAYSIAIIFSQTGQFLAKLAPFALREYVEQEYRYVRAGIERNDAIAVAFAVASPGEPNFSRPGAGNIHTSQWERDRQGHDPAAFRPEFSASRRKSGVSMTDCSIVGLRVVASSAGF